MSELNELSKVNSHVKLHRFSISYSSYSFHLVQGFLKVFLREKHILVHQCETARKHQQGRGRKFFSCYVVKVREFMKLSFACVDIVSTGFTRY